MADSQLPLKHRVPAHPLLWIYRCALAIGLPILLFAVLEAGLRLGGYGHPATFLIADDEPGFLRTNPDFASLFLPGNFDLRPLNFRIAVHKPAHRVRIVVLGESAAQGVPVPSFSFAPQLRAQLRARYPGKEFEVINTGIVAINSHVVYQIARELARYQPDLFLVYMGNNEVVGPYGPGCAYLSTTPPLPVIRSSVWVRSTRTGQLLAAVLARASSGGRRSAEWGGMSMFVNQAVAGDDPRLTTVYDNFGANLRGIVQAAAGAGAKVVLCTVVANLKDCPPFLSRHRAGLTAAELANWQADFDTGRLAWMLGEDERARSCVGRALERDPNYADASFILGSLAQRRGDMPAARRYFVDALHWDALRFRPDPAINGVLRRVAAENPDEVVLVDSALDLGADPNSTCLPSGREILFEHVHFDWEGNFRLGRLMARACAAALFGPDPAADGGLDNAACAAALAYTPHERPPMLIRMDVLTRKPPFTNQLTHVEDEARMAQEIEDASRLARVPDVLEGAASVGAKALKQDPENPALAGILEGIWLDRGDLEGALALARQAAFLLPHDYALSADEASILLRIGRMEEAGKILAEAGRSGADLELLGPVEVEYWTRTKRFDEGIQTLSAAIMKHPRESRLRVMRGGLLQASGDLAAAEREFRAALALNPASEEALEGEVSLLLATHRPGEAARASAEASSSQPRNQANSLRAVQEADQRGDAEGSIRNLLLAESSGPVTATFELTLALKLYQAKRFSEMMFHLATAQNLSRHEGNPTVTASIGQLIARMRTETRSP